MIVMKKLGKLEINPERLMKNKELISIKGGYSACTTTCYSDMGNICYGFLLCYQESCDEACQYAFGDPAAYGIPSTCP
jgi:hypothetical protein